MYRIVEGSTHGLRDTEEFVRLLGALDRHASPAARSLFDSRREVFVARAPGRLDLMGGIADYSGSLVLQLPLGVATHAAVQRASERTLRVVSLRAGDAEPATEFVAPLSDFEPAPGRPVDYAAARASFARDPARQWAAYVAGVLLVLMRERGVEFGEGARVLIASEVPEGKGVSSSAAIEVAVMRAVAGAFRIGVEARELALLCQRVENMVVGAPCGVMDQMTSACGEAGRLLRLLCQPAELLGTITLPKELSVWGIDSGVRHAVTGADYGSVRTGAFMGYRIIADLAGMKATQDESGPWLSIDDTRWRGYLANVSPSEFERLYAGRLPESMTGADFLGRYGGTTDRVTRVEPGRTYDVRTPTAHPVYEHFRVRAFAALLDGEVSEERGVLLGEMMYQSHASYSACGLGSDGTDLLVELAREAGSQRGIYGAKITGGGSGGTVAILGRRDAGDVIEEIASGYARRTGRQPHVFSGSSMGAAAFGHLRLMREA